MATRRARSALLAAGIANALAWAAFLFLLLWPVYQGVENAPPGTVDDAVRPFKLTLIQVNGLRVLPLIFMPVAVTGFGFWVSWAANMQRRVRRMLLWGATVVLLAFCLAGIFSIGLLYVPAWLALLRAALRVRSCRSNNNKRLPLWGAFAVVV